MTTQDKARNHIRQWLEEHGMTDRELSRMAGKGPGYVRNLLAADTISYKPFVVLDRYVDFPTDLLEQVKEEYTANRRHCAKLAGSHRNISEQDLKILWRNQALQAWGRVA